MRPTDERPRDLSLQWHEVRRKLGNGLLSTTIMILNLDSCIGHDRCCVLYDQWIHGQLCRLPKYYDDSPEQVTCVQSLAWKLSVCCFIPIYVDRLQLAEDQAVGSKNSTGATNTPHVSIALSGPHPELKQLLHVLLWLTKTPYRPSLLVIPPRPR
ncbi:hypothetical protein EJ03DRAFT_52428 [Teratosphaeria nubilosa]|uniref:Uncharacterized protein n=1 Tax=Teratosphaeria nubilosa TaxID=161662 RepID=A0A6G1KU44_9PEZI|nr:hypothetical protein EJ03DRAFT_52428 [Teratosphaeria nubilosa]